MLRPKKTIRHINPPDGFQYSKDIVSPDEEIRLVRYVEKLPLREFEFQGYLARRRTISFGWHYKFGEESLEKTKPIPDVLLPLREKAANFATLAAYDLVHALVTEYRPGTPIGWHRDKGVFGDVIGISLCSRSLFRFRRRTETGWDRYTHILDPRSIYLLRGDVRTNWEHSIPEVEELRYSITFRSIK
jgi:alkylated DNA repair dioxygenase AlkB